MYIKFRIGSWKFSITIAQVQYVIGVNSLLPDGNHILMWDFDNTNFWRVHDSLLHIQRIYNLPNIYILETKPHTNFIAYCFKRTPWRKAVEIIASTKGVDWNFFKHAVYREYFTLRVSPKRDRKPKLVYVLRSRVPEDVTIEDLKSWVKYETVIDKTKHDKLILEVDKKRLKAKLKMKSFSSFLKGLSRHLKLQ